MGTHLPVPGDTSPCIRGPSPSIRGHISLYLGTYLPVSGNTSSCTWGHISISLYPGIQLRLSVPGDTSSCTQGPSPSIQGPSPCTRGDISLNPGTHLPVPGDTSPCIRGPSPSIRGHISLYLGTYLPVSGNTSSCTQGHISISLYPGMQLRLSVPGDTSPCTQGPSPSIQGPSPCTRGDTSSCTRGPYPCTWGHISLYLGTHLFQHGDTFSCTRGHVSFNTGTIFQYPPSIQGPVPGDHLPVPGDTSPCTRGHIFLYLGAHFFQHGDTPPCTWGHISLYQGTISVNTGTHLPVPGDISPSIRGHIFVSDCRKMNGKIIWRNKIKTGKSARKQAWLLFSCVLRIYGFSDFRQLPDFHCLVIIFHFAQRTHFKVHSIDVILIFWKLRLSLISFPYVGFTSLPRAHSIIPIFST